MKAICSLSSKRKHWGFSLWWDLTYFYLNSRWCMWFSIQRTSCFSPPYHHWIQPQAVNSLMLAWRTSVHIKHIIALAPTWCRVFLYINKNMVYSITPHRRDDRAVLFYIEPRFYPLLRCPIISLLSIYFCFRSLSLSYSCFLSPCVQWVWCFSFSLSEVVSGVQRWRVSGVRVSLLTADERKKHPDQNVC